MNATNENFDKVLSIYANPNGFGYSVMTSPLVMIDKGVVRIRPIDNTKLLERVQKLIKEHSPETIVIENIAKSRYRKGERTRKFLQSIKAVCRRKNINIKSYTRDDVRNTFSVWKATTKHEIAEVISQNIESMSLLLYDKPKYPDGEPYVAGIYDALSFSICHYFVST